MSEKETVSSEASVKATLEQIAATRAIEVKVRAKDWQISFKLVGKKGETKFADVIPEVLFRGEKLVALDTSSKPGLGTRILTAIIGQKLQMPMSCDDDGLPTGTLSIFYSHNTLGNGSKFDTCQLGQSVRYLIRFEEDCCWEATLFGTAIDS